jgi:hypothetical protein
MGTRVGMGREIGRLDESCISNPKSEISNWTVRASRCPDGGRDNPTGFLIFRDNRGHFVARRETIGNDLFQP